ncbi:MAG: M56 family metallopeptidase [Chitinophagaceae bacterium]|nr:M56 family metallopeptidase [Chitinophagaceae bacterium]
MQFNFANHFFQALGYALLNSFWQVALLWLLFMLFNSKKNKTPQNNFVFLVVIQTIGFIWFLQTFITAYQQNFTLHLFLNSATINSTIYDAFFLLIGLAYLLCVVFVFVKFVKSYSSLKSLKGSEVLDITQEWNYFIDQVCSSLQITKNIVVKVSTKISTPLTIGVFKPIILLPIAVTNSLTTAQLEAIIVHELAHIKRNDYLINLFLLLIDTFMFFNPFTKAIKKQILLEREHCCDDIVLQHHYSAQFYSEALLQIAALRLQQKKLSFVVNAVSTKKELLIRIQRILNFQSTSKTTDYFGKIFFFPLIIAGIAFMTATIRKESTTTIQIINNLHTKITKPPSHKSNQVFTKVEVEQKLNVKPGINNDIATSKSNNIKTDLINTLEYFKPNENNNKFLVNQIQEEEFDEVVNLNQPELAPVVIAPAMEKFPIVTTQKFFIPATSSKPASVIIITTSENEKGKKTVQIEIVKGTSAIE